MKYSELKQKLNEELRVVEITYTNGKVITTNMGANVTDEEIRKYFAIGRTVNLGRGDKDAMTKIKSVKIIK